MATQKNIMPIKINVSIIDGGISKPVASHTLEKSRITIGRDPECTLPLVDPKKFVSRIHAEIEEKEGVYWMRVVSKVNPVLVNEQCQSSGTSVALATGDLLTFGKYRLEMLIPAKGSAKEDLSDELTYVHRPTAKKMIPEQPAEPFPASKKSLPVEATYIPLPEQEMFPEQLLPSAKKNLSVEATYIPLPEQEVIHEHKTQPEPLMDENEAAEITYIRPSRPKPNAQSDAGDKQSGEDSVKRLLRAFFQGVGLDEMEVADPEAFLHDSGEIVRVAVEGIMLLLTTRALALEELGITEPTSTNTHSDNLLKSMSDSREVIAFLFDPEKRTSTAHDPIQTFGDACADLRAHEIALIEGMRTIALSAILSVDPIAFDRAQEEGLGTPGRNRKSKLWDLFVAYHNKLAHDTRNDFKAAFGHNMTNQYLVNFRRLRGSR